MNPIKELRKLKNIRPEEIFIKRSKFLILQIEPQTKRVPSFHELIESWSSLFNIAFTFGVIMLLVIATNNLNKKNIAFAGLVDTKLQEEMTHLTKGIEEPSLIYYTESNRAVSKALDEIEKDKNNHLNERVLQNEIKELKIENPINSKIDNLLEDFNE